MVRRVKIRRLVTETRDHKTGCLSPPFPASSLLIQDTFLLCFLAHASATLSPSPNPDSHTLLPGPPWEFPERRPRRVARHAAAGSPFARPSRGQFREDRFRRQSHFPGHRGRQKWRDELVGLVVGFCVYTHFPHLLGPPSSPPLLRILPSSQK